MATTRKEISNYFETISLIILGLMFITFPLVWSTSTTDLFSLPKQIVLGVGALLTLLVLLAKMIAEGEVKLRRTPFDFPVVVFGAVIFISCLFSRNPYDAFIAFAPVLFALIAYFGIVNVTRKESGVVFLLSSLVIGGVILSVLATLSFLKIYPLPLGYTHIRVFSAMGSLLDQAVYIGILLPVVGYFSYATLSPLFSDSKKQQQVQLKATVFGISTLILAIGFVVTLFDLFTLQPPLILPFQYGFQTAFAAISQDTTRTIQSFLFGSGYGTYLNDFTRFKAATFNSNSTLWSFTFFRSSTYVLELLATIGVVGLLAFFFVIYRVIKEKPRKLEGSLGFYLSLLIAIIAAFVLPYSFITVCLFIFILALFAAVQGLVQPNKVYDLSLALLAFRKNPNLFSQDAREEKSFAKILPGIAFVIFLLFAIAVSYFGTLYVLSDLTFQKSIVAASQNNLAQTYQLERDAIGEFQYRDAYLRIFSQTNLAVANALATTLPRNSTPSAQQSQQIYAFVQQSINAGRQAVILSPLTSLDWQNLSSVYRALIGFGQQADSFSIAANQQAIALDPNNPQEYINLGGIYYQLQQWDAAITQFQIAANLKPDYANAYYNLGHAYEQKGDLQNALKDYQAVQQLVASDSTNRKKITDEIAALQQKIGNQHAQNQTGQQPTQPAGQLALPTPPNTLPERNPKAKIPAPGVTEAPATTPTPAQ